jgi:hypothetical protein
VEGSQAFLDAGSEYSIEDLLKSVIVASANDSAIVLAEGIGGNENNFVKFTKLYKYAPNAFSYKIMNWVLMNKYFNENDFIEMKDVFKRAGCLFQLKKIAKENNYTELSKVL